MENVLPFLSRGRLSHFAGCLIKLFVESIDMEKEDCNAGIVFREKKRGDQEETEPYAKTKESFTQVFAWLQNPGHSIGY